MQAIFKTSAVVCYMQTPQGPFEAAFFSDASAAAALRVCLTRSGSRYLYRMNDQTVDAAYPLYWTLAGTVVTWTRDARLDADLKRVLGANAPVC